MSKLTQKRGIEYLLRSISRGDGAAELSSPLTRYYAESGTPPGRFLGSGLGSINNGLGVAVGTEATEEQLRNMIERVGDPITGEILNKRSRVGQASSASGNKVAGFDFTFSPSKSISVAWAMADAGTQAAIYQEHQAAIADALAWAEKHMFFSRSGTNGIVIEDIEGIIAAAFDHWDSRAGDPQLHTHVVIQNLARSSSDGQWRTLDSRGLHKWAVALSEAYNGILSDRLTDRLGWSFDNRQRPHSKHPRYEVTGVANELSDHFSQRSVDIIAAKDQMIDDYVATHGRHPTTDQILKMRQKANLATRPHKHHHSLSELVENWRARGRDYVGEDTVAFVHSLRTGAGKGDGTTPRLRAEDFTADAMATIADAAVYNVTLKRPTFHRANVLAEVHRQMQGWTFTDPRERMLAADRITDYALGRGIDGQRASGATGGLAKVVALTPADRYHVPARFRRADGSSRLRSVVGELFTTTDMLAAEARLLEAGRTVGGPVVTLDTVVAVAARNVPGRNFRMLEDQANAVGEIATSGRLLDVLVGPAGTGKSTSMAALRAMWETEHGPGSVVGLAPSSKAAKVLADELGIDTENTAKWLHEHPNASAKLTKAAELRRIAETGLTRSGGTVSARGRKKLLAAAAKLEATAHRYLPKAGQLYIVDEASLAGTHALDRLVAACNQVGAKVLLVGDWAQLSAVDPGGAFKMLVDDRISEVGFAPELVDPRRFKDNPWEQKASLQLRYGDHRAIDAYLTHGRVVDGDRDAMLAAIYAAWSADVRAGRTSLMIAGDRATVAELNTRAQADRIAAGEVHGIHNGLHPTREAGGEVGWGPQLHDGTTAYIGDRIVTTENKRRLLSGPRGWVKNGDEWIVTALNPDGSMTVQRAIAHTTQLGKGAVVLPADYVAEKVELAYASTAHRAQGATVATAHALITPTTQREVCYVAATRARTSNMLYVDTHYDPHPDTSHGPAEARTAAQVLAGVLDNSGADVAATVQQHLLAEERRALPFLRTEYTTIARTAAAAHWATQVRTTLGNHPDLAAAAARISAEDTAEDMVSTTEIAAETAAVALAQSPHFPALCDTLQTAYYEGLDPQTMLTRAVAQAVDQAGADDLAARVEGLVGADLKVLTAEAAAGGATTGRVVKDRSTLGLLSYPHFITDPADRRALDERAAAMRERALDLVDQALTEPDSWLIRDLGVPPMAPQARETWRGLAAVVAAYRELHGHDGATADMVRAATNRAQLGEAKTAAKAAARARHISDMHAPSPSATGVPGAARVPVDRPTDRPTDRSGPML